MIVGALDLAAYPELARHAPRIETRLRLPLHDLFGEVARFDVNLAPLELGNLFCEAKSPLRLLAAAAVEVPSVDTALRRHPARLDRLHCRRRRGLGGRARMPAG